MISNSELIVQHHIDQERRGLLPNSIYQRDGRVFAFSDWISPRSLLEATPDDINRFIDSRQGRSGGPISAKSRYSWLTHLHSFYEWAKREEFTDTDPTLRIVRPKLRRALPRPASTEELRSAMSQANPQELCWLLLAAYMGLRCQEIAGLRREDVIEAEGVVRVTQAKGGHERLVPLHPDVLEALRALPLPRTGYVFTRPLGGVYSPGHLSKTFNDFLRRVGVNATAHQLRHWFGTTFYAQSGHDLRATQEMLGHASPATTSIYTAFDRRAAAATIRTVNFDPEAA